MRWTLLTLCAAVAVAHWLPGQAAEPVAQPVVAAATTAGADAITFEQYRDWRLAFNARRREAIAAELAAGDLPAARRTRLEQVKAYYDRLAGLPEAERDRLFRGRFEQIDADHDGRIDAKERTAWRETRRALYRRDAAPPRQPAAAEAN